MQSFDYVEFCANMSREFIDYDWKKIILNSLKVFKFHSNDEEKYHKMKIWKNYKDILIYINTWNDCTFSIVISYSKYCYLEYKYCKFQV